MYTTIDSLYAWSDAREDVRVHLGWQGFVDLFEYYESIESANGEQFAYDPSLFLGWSVGETPAELLGEYNPEILKEILANNTFADDFDRDEAILDELREHGTVVLGSDRYYFNEEI